MNNFYNSRKDDNEEVYSKPVRAGRRTYFFDVKATKGDDYFITITESRKKQNADGSMTFDKHKIYLYKEDFEKFREGFDEVVAFIKNHKPQDFLTEEEKIDHVQASMEEIDREFDSL